MKHLHPGFYVDMQRNAALSHCITCNTFVTGPCGWSDCELKGARPAGPSASGAEVSFHSETSSRG